MNKWRLWSGVASIVLGILGYIVLVYLGVTGVIPLDLDMDTDSVMTMIEQMDETTLLMIGRSGSLVELLFVAGIVSIVGHNRRWYWNIPVALMSAQAAMYGFQGYKYLYAIAAWAAVVLFMSIVAMRTGYRALHAPEPEETAPETAEPPQAPQSSQEKPQAEQTPQAEQPLQAPWEKPQAEQAPQAEQPLQAPWEKLQAEQTPQAPQAAQAPDEPAVNMPPRAKPIDDYDDCE